LFLWKCVFNIIRRLRIIYIWELKHPIWHRTYTVVPALIRIYGRSVYLRFWPLSSVTMCSGSEKEGDTKKSKGSLIIIIIIGRFLSYTHTAAVEITSVSDLRNYYYIFAFRIRGRRLKITRTGRLRRRLRTRTAAV